MHRVCFLLRVRRDSMEEYRAAHREVWPEMLHALKDSGWNNYSLFLAPDGLLVGYLETPDFAAAQEAMARTRVNTRWQQAMGNYFEELDGAGPDEAMVPLEEIFHLEDQLDGLG